MLPSMMKIISKYILLDFTIETNPSLSPPLFTIAPIATLPLGTTSLLIDVPFSNTLTLSVNHSKYSQFIKITPNVYNSINLQTIGRPEDLSIVYDPNGTRGIETTILEIVDKNASINGCRVTTYTPGKEINLPFSINNITNNGKSYSDQSSLFDISKPLIDDNKSDSLELLYANGLYVTTGLTPEYYIKYKDGKLNPNYEHIEKKRYVTFAWKTRLAGCSTLIFTLKNVSTPILQSDYNNNHFTLYYIIEDPITLTTSTPLGLADSSETDFSGNNLQNYYGTTNWIVGSDSINNPSAYVLSNNYKDTSRNFNGFNSSTAFTTDLSFNVNLPSQNTGYLPFSSPYYYIYFRIALDTGNLKKFSPFGFLYIGAFFTFWVWGILCKNTKVCRSRSPFLSIRGQCGPIERLSVGVYPVIPHGPVQIRK
jgi:hypothetical protein